MYNKYKTLLLSITVPVLFYYVYTYNVQVLNLVLGSTFLGNAGVFLCFLLAALGTIKGISSISSIVSGTAILIPRVWARSTVGTLVCEGNLIVGLIMATSLYKSIDPDNLPAIYGIFIIGVSVGSCCYISSVAAGLICSSVTVVDARDKKVFSKVAVFELLAGSYGIISMAIGFLLRDRFTN